MADKTNDAANQSVEIAVDFAGFIGCLGRRASRQDGDEHGLLQRYIKMHVLTHIRRHVHDQQ